MSNLALRFLTALLLIPLLIAAIEWRNPLGVWLWVLAAQLTGLREWMNMTMPKEPRFDRGFGVVLGALYGSLIYYFPTGQATLFGLFGVTLAGFLFFLFRHGAIETVATRVSFLLTGVLYAGVLITPLALMKRRDDGSALIYICLTSAWLSDTGAYFAGRFIGKYIPAKLWETISPKKTWAGGFGGLGGSFLALSIAKLWYLPTLSWLDVALIAVPDNILGQLGDLCESLIKRSVGVKDSGVLLPGHGGMLDRIDALIFVVPYVYAYAQLRF
jgi:phosphatidate cytidylyltransferase